MHNRIGNMPHFHLEMLPLCLILRLILTWAEFSSSNIMSVKTGNKKRDRLVGYRLHSARHCSSPHKVWLQTYEWRRPFPFCIIHKGLCWMIDVMASLLVMWRCFRSVPKLNKLSQYDWYLVDIYACNTLTFVTQWRTITLTTNITLSEKL